MHIYNSEAIFGPRKWIKIGRYLWQNCYEQGETGYCPRERPYRPFSNGSLRFENSHSSFLYYSTRFEKCGYLPGWASVNTAFYSCYAGPGPERIPRGLRRVKTGQSGAMANQTPGGGGGTETEKLPRTKRRNNLPSPCLPCARHPPVWQWSLVAANSGRERRNGNQLSS